MCLFGNYIASNKYWFIYWFGGYHLLYNHDKDQNIPAKITDIFGFRFPLQNDLRDTKVIHVQYVAFSKFCFKSLGFFYNKM